MNLEELIERIAIDPARCHGKPCIRGTRIMVHQVLDLLAAGLTVEEVTSADYFPSLTPSDVQACIAFANKLVLNEDIYLVPTVGQA